jgi:NAD(P)-dependent dehydrogenase (short-subunit alcohol dehydrogenase family)
MKHFAFTFGPEIRVNAVLPGLLLTEWVSPSILLHQHCQLFCGKNAIY